MYTIIIPAHNEEDYLEETLDNILENFKAEVIVVDDGSRDKTGDIARKKGCRVIRHKTKKGKTTAVLTGVYASCSENLLLLDADLGTSAGETKTLLEKLLAGEGDMIIGILPEKKGGLGILRAFTRLILFRRKIFCSQPLSGQRALKKQILLDLPRGIRGFGLEVALLLVARKKKSEVVEIELPLKHRQHGRTFLGFLHRGRQFFDVTMALFRRY